MVGRASQVCSSKKQPYAVLVDSIERPYCFLDIADKVVGIGFLDENLRESLTYAFQEFEAGKLFLSMATHREFEGETDTVVSAIAYIFKQDGTVYMRREFFKPYRLETSTTSADVSKTFAAAPDFGEYEDFIRIERD
ncbi:MAG: lytic transglycosylase [Pseudomonadota bacterium]